MYSDGHDIIFYEFKIISGFDLIKYAENTKFKGNILECCVSVTNFSFLSQDILKSIRKSHILCKDYVK